LADSLSRGDNIGDGGSTCEAKHVLVERGLYQLQQGEIRRGGKKNLKRQVAFPTRVERGVKKE